MRVAAAAFVAAGPLKRERILVLLDSGLVGLAVQGRAGAARQSPRK
jgi:hypothetical protein